MGVCRLVRKRGAILTGINTSPPSPPPGPPSFNINQSPIVRTPLFCEPLQSTISRTMKLLLVLLAALAVSAAPLADADPENTNSDKRDLEPRVLWVTVKTERDVNCRAGPAPNSPVEQSFPTGKSIRAQCGVDRNSGLWLKVDPGPGLAWCWALAHYTNYYDPKVPTIDRC